MHTLLQNSGFGNQLQPQSLLSPEISYRVPTDKELVKVAKGIGKEFQQLALQLGLSNSRIDQIRGSYPLSVADQIIHLLLEWRKQRGRQATFQELEKAMISVGVDNEAALREIQL